MTLVIYADTLMVVTFMYCLSCLLLFGLIYRHPIRPAPLFVGATIGALLSTYMIIFFVKGSVPTIIGIIAIPVILLISSSISYKMKTITDILKAVMSLIWLSLAEAGVAVLLISVLAYRGKYWIGVYIISLVIIQGIAIILIVRQGNDSLFHRKVLKVRIAEYKGEYIRGLADSGNVLRSPDSCRPVIVFSDEYRDELSCILEQPFTMQCVTINGTDYIDGGYISKLSLSLGIGEKEYFHVPIAFSRITLSKQGIGAIIPVEYAAGLQVTNTCKKKD